MEDLKGVNPFLTYLFLIKVFWCILAGVVVITQSNENTGGKDALSVVEHLCKILTAGLMHLKDTKHF